MGELQSKIEELWESGNDLSDRGSAVAAIHEAIELPDSGRQRVAEIREGEVLVHEWLKKAILLLFRHSDLVASEVGPFAYVDRIPLKSDFAGRGVCAVPGASARGVVIRHPAWS